MDHSPYLGLFIDEARETLQLLNERILVLEEVKAADVLRSTLDDIFRAAHTLKGMSATMGFTAMAELTHSMEGLLDELRDGGRAVDAALSDLLFACVDALSKSVEAIAETGTERPAPEVQARLNALGDEEQVPQAAIAVAEKPVDTLPNLDSYQKTVIKEAQSKGFSAFWINVMLQEGCLLKGVRAYMVLNSLEQLGEVIKAEPPVPDLEEERFDHSFAVLVVSREPEDKVRQTVLDVSEIQAVAIEHFEVDAPAAEPIVMETVVEAVPEPMTEEPKPVEAPPRQTAAKGAQTVRVSTERLDTLVNLVGELVIDRTRLAQVSATHGITELSDVIRHVGSVVSDIQGVVMKLRMMPVDRVFNRFPRMIRDLAKELGKEVQLVIEGQETELDRLVIDELGEPLVHLLRNALDHGLESPEERVRNGKPALGTLKLSARHEGNHVIIDVSDDGRGIDPQIVARKAVEKGLISADEASKLNEKQVCELIFTPGFSTRDVASEVSGRGVGMDAVKSKVVSLGGAVEISSGQGKGSTVTVILPLTLAIIQAMLTEVGDEIFAVPLSFIDEAMELSDLNVQHVQGTEMALLRGASMPLVRLEDELSTKSGEPGEASVVVVRVGSKRRGLVVNRLLGQQEVVIKPISHLIGHVENISGAAILGDGRLALILDAATLI